MKSLYTGILLLCTFIGYSQRTFIVHFPFDSYILTSNAKSVIDSFLLEEKRNLADFTIRLHGYCDSIGSHSYNDQLSITRILTVKKYLLARGVSRSSVGNETGHGKKDPRYENSTTEGRWLNRRVEIVLEKSTQTYSTPVKDSRSLTEQVADTTTKAGTTLVLNNINFYGGSPMPLPESFSTLDELLEIMKVNYKLVIEVRGHICCIPTDGDSEYRSTGNGLSEERARMVYAHLVGNGISESRVSYKGFGHSIPIYPYPEKTEEERIMNRRVEIRIVSR